MTEERESDGARGEGGAAAVVAVVTRSPHLIERATDAAAAAGCAAVVVDDARAEQLRTARAVLLGSDVAQGLGRTGVARPEQSLIIGPDGQEAALWRLAGEWATAGAVALPSGSTWLVRWLHERTHGAARRRCVVAPVVSAAGGVGASTLAAAIAVSAAACGLRPLLVDAHPGPAGVDLLLGDADVGDHWSSFAGIRGFLDPAALQELPVLEGVRCLGWAGRQEVPLWQGALGSVVAAADRDHELVVVDAGLHGSALNELPRRSRPILVVPASWRGAMAAAPRLAVLREAFDEPPVVMLRDVGGRADPRAWLSHYEGCEVLMVGFEAGVIDDEEQGRPPGTRPRSGIARRSRDVLAALARRPEAA